MNNLPDIVTVMDFDDFIEIPEDELHDTVKQMNKLKKV